MMTLRDLYGLVEKHGFYLRHCNLPKGLLGLCIIFPGLGPIILLERVLKDNPKLEKCVLGEEIGHALTAPKMSLPACYKSFRKIKAKNETAVMPPHEYAAIRWATSHLMPTGEMAEALLKGFNTIQTLAQYFDVTEWFVFRKIEVLMYELEEKNGFPCFEDLIGLIRNRAADCGLEYLREDMRTLYEE